MSTTGAAPDALLAYERACAEMDEELLRIGADVASAVRDWSLTTGSCAAVEAPQVETYAREALAHDHRVGRVARRFCDADASYAFDSWTRAELETEALALLERAASAGLDGGPWLGAFIDRLQVEGLDELGSDLADAPPPKRGFLAGLWEGLTEGSLDPQSYADGWGQFGKAVGQFASGLAVYGDVRDAVAEYSRGNWLGGTFDAAGAIPGFGDAAKLVGFGAQTASIVRRADDMAAATGAARQAARAGDDAIAAAARELHDRHGIDWVGLDLHERLGPPGRPGHTVRDHVGDEAKLRAALSTKPGAKAVSGFATEAEAEQAILSVLTEKGDDLVAAIREGGTEKVRLSAKADGSWLVYPRAGPPAPATRVLVVAQPWPASPTGYRIVTAYPTR